MRSEGEPVEFLVTIPGLGPSEFPVVESLLEAAGIDYFPFIGDSGAIISRIQIRNSDLEEVKELLADFRIATLAGDLIPIPWET